MKTKRAVVEGAVLGLILGIGSALSAVSAPATAEKGTGVIDWENTFYFDAVGEEVYQDRYITFTYHLVQTPGGNYLYLEPYKTKDATITMIGLQSGTVWTLEKLTSPFVDRSAGGGMLNYICTARYVSETGPSIRVLERYHMSFDANGALRVENYELIYWVKE